MFTENYRKIQVRLTDGTEIIGDINIGEYKRVTDMFAQATGFIVLSNIQDRPPKIINKNSIMWAEPLK